MKRYLLLLFFSIAAIFYAQGFMVLYKAYCSTKWPAAQGVVISSTVTYHPAHGKSGPYYSPDVTYRYTVGKTTYLGDIISYASINNSSQSDMGTIAGRYPVGQQVKVFYDPAGPQESVLESGITFNSWTKVLGASIFLLMGLSVMLFYKLKTKKNITVRIKC